MNFLKIIITIAIFSFAGTIYAQKDICKNIYVWDFTDENSQKNKLTTSITQEVENALTETSCTVLQRRNYANLVEQVENEHAIQSIEEVSNQLNRELQSIKAETVIFGQVKMDFTSNIMLSISFESLLTKEILKSEFILLNGEYAHNIEKRQAKIKEFISHCVGPKVISNEEITYWKNVQALNTLEAFSSYLAKYPNGKFISQAEEILAEEQLWSKISKNNEVGRKIRNLITYTQNQEHRHFAEAREQLENLLWTTRRYEDYKVHFPAGKYVDQVKKKHEEEYYAKAMENPLSYTDTYLEKFPNGRYVAQVKAKYEEIFYTQAVESLSFGVKNYLEKFPNGKYISKVEDLVWGRVLSASKKSFEAKEYLKLFPTGKHAKEARKFAEKMW